jgi:putative membrane protein
MTTASGLFAASDRERVKSAVAQAESATSGEIVPVVATVSGRYDRAEDLVGLLTALVLLAAAWKPLLAAAQGGWGGGVDTAIGLGGASLTVVIGFVAGAMAATAFPALRQPFVPRAEMRDEVERRALEQFQRHRVRGTAGGTGVLIYVSLHERMVRVVGDDAIAARITQQDWDAISRAVVDGMAGGKPADGLVEAIRRAGELLAQHFPVQPGDVDELSNELTLID